MPNVLIGSGPLRHWPGEYRKILEDAGFHLVEPPGNDAIPDAEVFRLLPDCTAMIAGGEPVTAAMIAAAPRLRVIARVGVGYDAVDVAAATARGVAVTITPGTNQESVAEQAFALLLAVFRRVAINDRIIREGGWDRTVPRPLRGQTLGLVGLGRIGRAMAPRAVAFGMRVLAADPIADDDFDARHGIRRVPLDALLAESDVVSLHLPLTAETRKLFHRETFAKMKPGAVLLNTARGGLVDERDLLESLRAGHLAGAGLDVTDPEPPRTDNPLLALPNVVFSPHIGGADARSLADMATLAARCVVDLVQGRWPEGCVVNDVLRQQWRP